MTVAYLDGSFLPLEDARISPMDRGFLFGDGVYEVIPTYGGQLVGLNLHLDRLERGLAEIRLASPHSREQWKSLFTELLAANGNGNLGLYLQVTRGVSMKRAHRFPETTTPTCFAYTFPLEAPSDGNPETAHGWRVITGDDLRWQRRHIKSVALLGNVLHMQDSIDAGAEEILLFNEQDQLTEAAACNVFVVKDGAVATPPLDREKLPGITRQMLLDMMRTEGDWQIAERPVSRAEVMAADEVWITSSSKEVEPVVSIDARPVGTGKAGPIWAKAQAMFHRRRFDY